MSLHPLHGRVAPDPLDRLSGLHRVLLQMGVTTVLYGLMLWLAFFVFGVARARSAWLVGLELVVVVGFYAPIMATLRKSSWLVHAGLLFAIGFPLDLFVEAHFRVGGACTIWCYPAAGPLGGLPPLAQFLVVWAVDGLVAGPLALWVSRLLAPALPAAAPALPPDLEPPPERPREGVFSAAYQALFRSEWTEDVVPKPKRDAFFWGFLVIGGLYVFYLLLALLALAGLDAWPAFMQPILGQTFANPALTVNTFIKLSMMVALLFAAAYNPALRYHTSIILAVGHGVNVVASTAFFLTDPAGTPYRDFLPQSALVDGLFVAFFLAAIFRYRALADEFRPDKEAPAFDSLPHVLTRGIFYAFGGAVTLVFGLILYARLGMDPSHGLGAIYGFPDPQVCNSLTKYSTLAALLFMLANREALRERLIGVLYVAIGVSVVAGAAWLLLGDSVGTVEIQTRGGGTTTEDWYFMVLVALNASVAIPLMVIRKMFYDVEYGISVLSPSGARNVVALHDAFYGGTDDDHGRALAAVDLHIAGIQGRKRGLLNYPFWIFEHVVPLVYGLRPPLSVMSREERRWFLRSKLLRPPTERARAMVPEVADLMNMLTTALHSFITLAHYDDIKAWAEAGFIPPDARDRLQSDFPLSRPPAEAAAPLPDGPGSPHNWRAETPGRGPLLAPRVVTPTRRTPLPDEADWVVVGSGAGGATAAYRLAQEVGDPSRVVVLERGGRYSPLRDMSHHEMEMMRRFYKEGGLQQTKRFDMMVLQGECVGGSTVVNNAVCFELPQAIRDTWRDQHGMDLSGLQAAYDEVARELHIQEVPPDARNAQVEALWRAGVAGFNATQPDDERLAVEVAKVNFHDPMGSGYGAFGNLYLRKRSMLETYIPWAEGRGAQIVSDTSAVRFHAEGRRARSVTVRTRLGTHKRIRVRKGVIVAGGVIASSHFLMRSDVQGPVGHRVSANLAFPITAAFGDEYRNLFDGIQITMGAVDPKNRAMFENMANPPGTAAIELPFFFDRHVRGMDRYPHAFNLAALVPSEPRGRVQRKPDLVNGRALTWQLGPRDTENIAYALEALVRMAHAAGGREVFMTTLPGMGFELTEANVEAFAKAIHGYPLRMADFRMFTSHPIGGNILAADGSPKAGVGVVGGDYRVRGYDNVWVADASVLPTATAVNPQWTIMAVATLAARAALSAT